MTCFSHVFCASLQRIIFVTTILSSTLAIAGRPLTVDDANTNDKGEGHVEMWAARESGALHTLNVAPAYGVADGWEIGAQFTRDRTTPASTTALQLKWRITASQEEGCNVGAVVGAARTKGLESTTRTINGLFTCNHPKWGSLFLNLGSSKVGTDGAMRTWGAAIEREFASVTPSLEWYGSQGSKPAVQFGLRGDVAKNVQLDGTVGRVGDENIVSIGLKLQF